MMKKYKILISIIFINLILSSCGSLSNQKKNNTDEFLIEKKTPLSMPPDFEKLPQPKANQNSQIQEKNNNFESLIKNTQNNKEQTKSSADGSSSLEESVLKKIKKN